MESNLKPIIDYLFKQFGESGTIIEAKAFQLFNKQSISSDGCEKYIELLNNLNIFNNEFKKMNMSSILYYMQAETNPEIATVFLSKYEQWQNNLKQTLRSGNNIENLRLIYNIIEIEYRYRILNAEKIKLIEMQLMTYEKFDKCFEDYILYKYYDGVLKYLLGDYEAVNFAVMPIVIDISEELKNSEKSPLIEYIELKNSVLILQTLEKENRKENGIKEIISHLEALYKAYSKKDTGLCIKFAIKMCDFYLAAYEYDNVFILLMEIIKKLKNQMYFNNKKFPEFIEIFLNTISRVIFCAIMFGKLDDALRFLKKIDKLLNSLKDYDPKNEKETEAKENLLARYQFILFISKYIIQNNQATINKSDLNTCISEYRTRFKNTILSEDDVIINIYSLNSSDLLAKNFFDRIALNMSIVQSNKLVSVNYLSLFFSIYNQIAILTKNVTTDTNIKKQLEYVEKIRTCSKSVTEYVHKYCDFWELKIVFSLPYFKQVIIKTMYAYLFSFFFVREYKKCLEIFKELQVISEKLELNKGAMLKYYADIYKLRGDTLFKSDEYGEAINEYAKVIKIHEEYNNLTAVALLSFDLGICYCYVKNYELAKKYFLLSLNKFELLNSANQNRFGDKIISINSLMQKLNNTLFKLH